MVKIQLPFCLIPLKTIQIKIICKEMKEKCERISIKIKDIVLFASYILPDLLERDKTDHKKDDQYYKILC